MLFDQWEAPYLGAFSRDGIVSERHFATARNRVLFVLKEPNDHSQRIAEHAKAFTAQFGTWRNLAYWARGLLEGFPPFEQIESEPHCKRHALQRVAVVNAKKTPGKSKAIREEIQRFANSRRNRRFLRREIQIIDPDIIVCCGDVVGDIVKATLCPYLEWGTQNSPYLYGVHWKRGWIFWYYHPQYCRRSDKFLYESLRCGVTSFINGPSRSISKAA